MIVSCSKEKLNALVQTALRADTYLNPDSDNYIDDHDAVMAITAELMTAAGITNY